jgi:putative sigma-54 modulation protein
MNLTIELPHTSDAASVRTHADRLLRFALTRFTDAVSAVRLRLVDENGLRGGVDQRCRVQVVLRRGNALSIEAVGSDPHSVIHEVAARMARTLSRRLARLRVRRGSVLPRAGMAY